MTFWLKLDSYPVARERAPLFSTWVDKNDEPLRVSVVGRLVVSEMVAGNRMTVCRGPEVKLGDWLHIAVVVQTRRRAQELYVNGQLVNARSSGQTAGSKATRIWLGRHPGFAKSLDGSLSQFAFYGRALSKDEVKKVWSAQKPK